MTEISYPQQGLLVGDAAQAPYSADNFALHFTANAAGFARRANYGPVKGYDDGSHYGLEVTQTTIASANVVLRVGAALVRGTAYENDADLTLAVGANASGNPRIDTLILRKDYVLQTVRAAILQGTPAATPVPQTLTQNATTWEIPIADIAVANGFSTLTDANILPRHEWINVGDGEYIDKVLNNSGITLEDGDTVIWDYSAENAVTTTTTYNNQLVAGVWRGRTANGSYGRIQTKGYGIVKMRFVAASGGSTIPIGTALVTSSTARYAVPTRVPGEATSVNEPAATQTRLNAYSIGYIKESYTWAGTGTFTALVNAFIDVGVRAPFKCKVCHKVAGNTAGGTFTAGALQTRVLNTLIVNNDAGAGAGTGQNDLNPYVSIATNQITLQPGVYYIQGSAPAYRVNQHLVAFINLSGTVEDFGGNLLVGTGEYSPSAADSSQTRSWFSCYIRVITAAVFEVRHQCQTTRATDGFGVAVNFTLLGTPLDTIFTEVDITRFSNFPLS